MLVKPAVLRQKVAKNPDDWFASNAPTPSPSQNATWEPNTAPPSGQPKPNISAQDFVKQWQQTHAAHEGIGALADAMKAAGYGNVSRFMYGATPSNNELSIDGQKFKVISGEDSSNPSWYVAGTDDGGGGKAFTPPPAWGETFTAPTWDKKFQGPTSADLEADTGYQEQLKRGQQALERSAASRGTVLNPGTLKDLADYSQATASSEMDKLYGRKANEYSQDYSQYLQGVQQKANEYQQRYKQYLDAYGQAANSFGINYGVFNDDANRFVNAQNTAFNQQYSLAQLGMQGANSVTNAGSNFANQGGNAITNAANSQAASTIAGANAWNSAITGAINTGTSLYAQSRYGQRDS